MTSTRSSSEIEAIIVAAWREVLFVDHVGPDDNFFDVGGDSFRMAQIRDLLEASLRRDVSMLELFEYPTIAELAAFFMSPSPPPPVRRVTGGRAARRRRAFGIEGPASEL